MSTLKVSTISPLGTDSTKTITLGESAGTLAIASGAKTSGFGKIGQVVQTSLTASDYFSSTSSSLVEITGSPAFNVSITPTNTSSKVLITGHVSIGSGTGARVGIQLRRGDSTIIGSADAAGSRQRTVSAMRQGDGNYATTLTFNFLDSPATTSAVTYKIFGMAEGSETLQVNKGNGDSDSATVFRSASTLTAMEVLD